MSLLELAPLDATKPALGELNYPSSRMFQTTLASLQASLTVALINFLIARMKATGRAHQTAAEIGPALAGFIGVATDYMRVFYVAEPQWHGTGRLVVRHPPIRFGPSFKEVARTPLLSSMARLIDDAEKSLTTQRLSVAGFADAMSASTLTFVDAEQLTERLAWLTSVRTILVLVLFWSLDYKKVWDRLHGDTGIALSREVPDLAFALKSTKEFAELVELMEGRRSFWGLTFGKAVAPYLNVAAVQPQVQEWLQQALIGKHDLSELGSAFPFRFEPLPLDFYRRSQNQDDRTPEQELDCDVVGHGTGETTPPHMFARAATTQRACWVRRYWNRVRQEKLESGKGEDDEWKFRFKINAANLQFGGQHPPHAGLGKKGKDGLPLPEMGHRNGTELDVDLTHLPDLVRKGGSDMQAVPINPQSSLDGDPENEGLANDAQLIESGGSEALGQFVFPQETWEFPDGPEKEKLTEIATSFTECIFLTFPAYIIFASADIAFNAQSNLETRLTLLANCSKSVSEKQTYEMIGRFVHLIDTEVWRKDPPTENKSPATKEKKPTPTAVLPPEEAAKRAADRSALIAQHRNHWHVNWGANWLGSEPPLVTAKLDEAEARVAAMKFLEKDNRWRKVLGLDPIDDENQ